MESDWPRALADYLAGSYKFPIAASLGVGAACSWALLSLFPDLGKGMDPGLVLLATLCLPMAVTAAALMIWARSWRRRRAEEQAASRRTGRRR
jgi:drug/metabolite transporter (DMT)-like permease